MAYTDDWESLMNGVFGPGGRFKAAPGTSAPKTGGSAALPDPVSYTHLTLPTILRV